MTRITGLHNGSFKTTKARFFKMKTDLKNEIAARKKDLSIKLGTRNSRLRKSKVVALTDLQK